MPCAVTRLAGFSSVEPVYRDTWDVPGGVVEAEESPHAACRREVAEEIGLERPLGRVLAVDWVQMEDLDYPEGLVVIYDGGVLTPREISGIRVPAEELADFALVPQAEVATRTRSRSWGGRIEVCLKRPGHRGGRRPRPRPPGQLISAPGASHRGRWAAPAPVHGQIAGSSSRSASPPRNAALPPKSSLIQRAATRTETRAAPAARNARTADRACPPRAPTCREPAGHAPARDNGAIPRKCCADDVPRGLPPRPRRPGPVPVRGLSRLTIACSGCSPGQARQRGHGRPQCDRNRAGRPGPVRASGVPGQRQQDE